MSLRGANFYPYLYLGKLCTSLIIHGNIELSMVLPELYNLTYNESKCSYLWHFTCFTYYYFLLFDNYFWVVRSYIICNLVAVIIIHINHWWKSKDVWVVIFFFSPNVSSLQMAKLMLVINLFRRITFMINMRNLSHINKEMYLLILLKKKKREKGEIRMIGLMIK